MKLKQDIKIIINGKESEAIPFKDYNHARNGTKEEQAREKTKINYYGRHSGDIYYLETGNILKVRFY